MVAVPLVIVLLVLILVSSLGARLGGTSQRFQAIALGSRWHDARVALGPPCRVVKSSGDLQDELWRGRPRYELLEIAVLVRSSGRGLVHAKYSADPHDVGDLCSAHVALPPPSQGWPWRLDP